MRRCRRGRVDEVSVDPITPSVAYNGSVGFRSHRFVVASAIVAASCAPATQARPHIARPPESSSSVSPYIASWLSLAEGHDPFTNELRFEVRELVLSDQIASLDARGTETRDPALREALQAAEVRLVARVLALGLARMSDPRVERVADLLRQRLAFEPPIHSARWIRLALHGASVPPAAINLAYGSVADPEPPEIARAAIALAAWGFDLREPGPAREVDYGCMSPGWEVSAWTPASTAAIVIVLGADPEVVLQTIEQGVREMIALARRATERE